MIPVILSGGSGTRLWPLSRKQRPKQFLPVVEEETLFQSTVLRLKGIDDLEAPLIVCNENHRFMVAEQLRQLELSNQGIILEPIGRNTAPAIALAAIQASRCDPEARLLILPADHVIQDNEAFRKAIAHANQIAYSEYLVTFGIVPTAAETGYGYIQAINNLPDTKDTMLIKKFVEKPDLATATKYLENGNYFWNSGMFMFRADVYLEA
ncbi:MAG: mannose-1-phosphate guanylyltransferase, partial [bacterium]